MARAGLLLLLCAASFGCTIESTTVDRVPTITVNGQRYVGAIPNEMTVPPSELSAYGIATAIVDPGSVEGTSVLELAGVPPSKVVFMSSTLAGTPFLMFWSTDLNLGPDRYALFIAVPQLCPYAAPTVTPCRRSA